MCPKGTIVKEAKVEFKKKKGIQINGNKVRVKKTKTAPPKNNK